MLTYSKLWILLKKRGMKKTDLKKPNGPLSSATLAKLGKNEYVSSEVLGRICDFRTASRGTLWKTLHQRTLKKQGRQ